MKVNTEMSNLKQLQEERITWYQNQTIMQQNGFQKNYQQQK